MSNRNESLSAGAASDDDAFAGKVAIVTGTTGIGRATALTLAERGASVMALGIDEAANAALSADAGMRGLEFEVRRCDVSDADDVAAAVEATVEAFGGVDIVVNSAAVHPYGDAAASSSTSPASRATPASPGSRPMSPRRARSTR